MLIVSVPYKALSGIVLGLMSFELGAVHLEAIDLQLRELRLATCTGRPCSTLIFSTLHGGRRSQATKGKRGGLGALFGAILSPKP